MPRRTPIKPETRFNLADNELPVAAAAAELYLIEGENGKWLEWK